MAEIRARLPWRGLFWLALGTVTWLSLRPSALDLPHQSDKLAHALAFLGLALLAGLAYPGRRYPSHLALPLLAYGLGIEILQGFTGYRTFSLLDWAADAAGLALAPWFAPYLSRLNKTPP